MCLVNGLTQGADQLVFQFCRKILFEIHGNGRCEIRLVVCTVWLSLHCGSLRRAKLQDMIHRSM